MPSLRRGRGRSRSLQTAMLLWSLWRWLPPSQKRRALLLASKHGPWFVRQARRGRRR